MAEAQEPSGRDESRASDHDHDHDHEPQSDNDSTAPASSSSSSSSSEQGGSEQGDSRSQASRASRVLGKGKGREDADAEDDDDEDEDDDDDDGDEDEEPRLKYARLTQSLAGVYRNGDATSAFLVAGDKMIVGTHNGNIHVFQLPACSPLRVYHAHAASITAISISPFPPPLPTLPPEQLSRIVSEAGRAGSVSGSVADSRRSETSSSPRAPRHTAPPPVLNTPSNNIYIATASTDGHVCVQSLVDSKDVQLRNFGRPVQAVALSPEYKQDRTYLSGGLAGSLVLTVGGQPGRSTSTTVGTAAAAASGWLGSMGLGTNTGRDSVLHAGEGTVSTIQWSLSGQYVAWLNEMGIKIMRTKTQLESVDADRAWTRIGHIDRPETEEWDAMATAWRGRAQWLEAPDGEADGKSPKSPERLLVGWGSTIWIVHVHPGGVGVGRHVGERSVGHAEIVQMLRMDCIISGIALYAEDLLLVLAYCRPDDDNNDDDDDVLSQKSHSTGPTGGIRRRRNNLPPELRLIDLTSQAEVDKDVLGVSRFERLGVADYHLGVLPAQTAARAATTARGTLEALTGLGAEMWNAAVPKVWAGTASVRSGSEGGSVAGTLRSSHTTATAATAATAATVAAARQHAAHPSLAKPGIKVFIHSPYDCILATQRDQADHLAWLLEHGQYQKAWELVDAHPEAVDAEDAGPGPGPGPSPSTQGSSADDDDDSVRAATAAEREKRRIGELWLAEAVAAGDWARAGRIAGKVLRTADRWAKWVWTFAGAGQVDAVADVLPTKVLSPPIPPAVYEVVLAHYLREDRARFAALLGRWPPEGGLYGVPAVVRALEATLEGTLDGEHPDPIVLRSLLLLHEAQGRYREALRYALRLPDADTAFRLIRANHLADAVADDIPRFFLLRVGSAEEAGGMAPEDLDEATAEAVALLVDEAQHGLVQPATVLEQLQRAEMPLFAFFYLRGLWRGDGLRDHLGDAHDRLAAESRALVDGFADLAVRLFARYDRGLLKAFLQASTAYSFDQATTECEKFSYTDELVFLYAKTGQMKRALALIIDRLGDVSQAIAFARSQNDPDLWEDLLTYSMDKPRFIRGLLEEAGTAIDPITLVRRIPEGLAVDGLREGLRHLMKEHEIQHSLSAGVAQILRSEVSQAQVKLRAGQRRGIKFGPGGPEVRPEVRPEGAGAGVGAGAGAGAGADTDGKGTNATPAACARCHTLFTPQETDLLVGFACGHAFHLGHLLDLAPDEAAALGLHTDTDPNPDPDDADTPYRSRRTMLGTKITHARLLKDRIRGCPACEGGGEST